MSNTMTENTNDVAQWTALWYASQLVFLIPSSAVLAAIGFVVAGMPGAVVGWCAVAVCYVAINLTSL